jgi:coproporphyrinogen III oxidase-like Fe-S oxidoreductase
MRIKHVSFYSLELKETSLLNKQNYKLDEYKVESQLSLIIKLLADAGYKRYEVSS